MRRLSGSIAISLLGLGLLGACGGSGGGMDARQVVGGASAGAGAATFHAGELPAPHGALTVTVPSDAHGLNGGSTTFEITASGTIVTVYVAVDGQTGYWRIPVPAGTSIANVLLTFAQQLAMRDLSIIFEVADSAGNISPPAMTATTIIMVGTGDVAVSLSWDVTNDLDLHVVDPTGTEIYYANQQSADGTIMLQDLDSNAGCFVPDGIDNEHIVWPTGKAPRGQYIVRVDNFSNCTASAASYVVTVAVTGHPAQTFTGSFLATDAGDAGGDGDGVMITTFTY